MSAPDKIWIAPTDGSNGVDDFYLLDPVIRGNRGTEFVRADIVQELAAALEEISEIDDVCRRNVAFRKNLGWYEDETIRVRDQHNAMAWAEAAKIARAALAKLKEAGGKR